MELIVKKFDGSPDKSYQYHEIELLADPLSGKKSRDVVFVTGNKNKVAELKAQMKNKSVNIIVHDLDLIEIQDSDVLKIVGEKCKQAFREVNKLAEIGDRLDAQSKAKHSVLIEDCCLNYKALNGMPGPYVKWFLKSVGIDGLHKILDGYEDKTAEAVCIYALMDDESSIVFCKGYVKGKIVSPRGSSWGWDPIFQEERSCLTYGEMDFAMKAKFSHRSNAITVLNKYLTIGEIAR